MRKILAIVAGVAVLMSGNLMAAEKTAVAAQKAVAVVEQPAVEDAQTAKAKAMEKVAVMKGRILVKWQDIGSLMDTQVNGVNALQPSVRKIYDEISTSNNTKIQEENAKAQEMRNVTLVDNLNKKNQKRDAMWAEFDRQLNAYHGKKNALATIHGSIYNNIFNPARNMDEACSLTGIDPELLMPLLSGVDKRLGEIKAEMTDLNANWKDTVTTWETFAKE